MESRSVMMCHLEDCIEKAGADIRAFSVAYALGDKPDNEIFSVA